MKEVVDYFRRNASTLTRLIGSVDTKAKELKSLRARLDKLEYTVIQA